MSEQNNIDPLTNQRFFLSFGRCSATTVLLLLLTSWIAGEVPSPETRVVVMGIAQDGGVPQIGCTQEICRTQHHLVSSLAIIHQQSIYLIDATPDLRQQYQELMIKHPEVRKNNLFDGIFLTHAHMGHYTGLMFVGKESIST